jgi:hypothetical protein
MSIFIQSLLDESVIDVEGAKAVAGTALDAFPIKFNPGGTPPTAAQLSNAANQLWTTVDGPFTNSFFLQSSLGSNLVVDIKGAKDASGTPLQIYSKKATGTQAQNDSAKNQLWTWVSVPVPGPGPLRMTYFMIQSLLDSSLVIDIKGASTKAGALLQVYSKKQTATTAQFDEAKNQLWSQVLTYDPPPK